jgi:hypothetical protein
MGKSKKKFSEIKDALLSKTSFIKNNNEPEEMPFLSENTVEIDKQVYSKFKLLANFQHKTPVELINEALSHYLRLKKLDIDEALKNIVVGSEEDE